MNSQDCFDALYGFRFEYIFQLNIQSVKDCDPTKFSKEMGPHYVSCILSIHKSSGEIIPLLKHHTVEMYKESADKVLHMCKLISRCMWVISSIDKSRGQISCPLNWGWVNAKVVLVLQQKSLTPVQNQILFFLHTNNYFVGYCSWWSSVMDIKDKAHLVRPSNQW
jgi:hypothetical protein